MSVQERELSSSLRSFSDQNAIYEKGKEISREQ